MTSLKNKRLTGSKASADEIKSQLYSQASMVPLSKYLEAKAHNERLERSIDECSYQIEHMEREITRQRESLININKFVKRERDHVFGAMKAMHPKQDQSSEIWGIKVYVESERAILQSLIDSFDSMGIRFPGYITQRPQTLAEAFDHLVCAIEVMAEDLKMVTSTIREERAQYRQLLTATSQPSRPSSSDA